MQDVPLLATNVKSETFAHGALPRWTELFVKRGFDHSRRIFIIFGGLKLVDCHGGNINCVTSHFRWHVRILEKMSAVEILALRESEKEKKETKNAHVRGRNCGSFASHLDQRLHQVLLEFFLIDDV